MLMFRVIDKVRRFLVSGLLLLLLLPAAGQLIQVHSQLGSDSLMIGEQIEYTLRVEASKEVEFTLPSIEDTLSSTIEVIAPLSSDTIFEENRILIEHSYLITVFEPGSQIVPYQEVIYKKGALSDTARSMPLILHVYAPEIDTSQQIKPIKAPINTPVTFKEILPWAAIGLGGLLITGAVLCLLLRFLRRK